MTKNILIDMLEYGDSCLLSTRDFKREQIVSYLKELGYKQEVVNFAVDFYLAANFVVVAEYHFRINSDGLSRLMTYQSLQTTEIGILKADKSINIAKKSLWIAIGVGMVSILITLYSILRTTSVSLDVNQEKKFTKENQVIFRELQKVDQRDSVLLQTLINLQGVSLAAPKPQKLTAPKVHH